VIGTTLTHYAITAKLSRNDVVQRGARASRVLPSPSRRGLPSDARVFTKWLLVSGGPEVFGETPHTARGTRALPNPVAWLRLSGSGMGAVNRATDTRLDWETAIGRKGRGSRTLGHPF